MSKLGLYLHVPFCERKCPYCDFYSVKAEEELLDRYTLEMRKALFAWGQRAAGRPVETVYFGGGTPSLLGAGRMGELLETAFRAFSFSPFPEITAEVNPTSVDAAFFRELRRAGCNRLSLGMQSANEEELRLLGRRHSPEDVAQAVADARHGGFENISLDLMLGLPGGSEERLANSIAFAAGLGVEHISAYLLKIEEHTPFATRKLPLPEEDEAADLYLFSVKELAARGFCQYEISNFSRSGQESRHNLIYWHGEEYLGLGPGAHSFFEGKRFYYPRDLKAFLQGEDFVEDGTGGSFFEYAMLNLRLTEGLTKPACEKKFGPEGGAEFERMLERAKNCPPGLIRAGRERLAFTPEGFLVSNALLLKLLPNSG